MRGKMYHIFNIRIAYLKKLLKQTEYILKVSYFLLKVICSKLK